ncbi:MAG: Uma2 family endonuclease [Aggregatilineales bacterium]
MVATTIATEITQPEPTVGMSMADFFCEYDEHGPFELLNGEIIRLSPTKLPHSLITHILRDAINDHCRAPGFGLALSEIPFVLSDKSDWVKGSRVPDVLFIRADRLAAYKQNMPDWENKPLILVPDLVVEIVSPTDQPDKVLGKVALYLADGVPLVWVLDRTEQTIAVYRADKRQPTLLSIGDSLDGGDVIPGFSLPIATLFDIK